MVALTTQQQTTLKAFVEADPVLSTIPQTADGAFEVARRLALDASPDWYVYRTNVFKSEIQDAVDYARMTPAQAIPTTGADAQNTWIAKALLAQGKQFNLQNLLLGNGDTINCARSNLRAAFQDCLTALPTTAAGGNQQAGWAAVQLIMSRKSNVLEKLFATGGNGTQATPSTMAVEGSLNYVEVAAAMQWPV